MALNNEWVKGSIPLLLLSVIAQEDMYGYKIVKELETRSENVFCLKEGTLYPALHTLEAEGLVTSYWVDMGSRKRKYYHITRKGKNRLKEKQEAFRVYTAAVDRVLNFA